MTSLALASERPPCVAPPPSSRLSGTRLTALAHSHRGPFSVNSHNRAAPRGAAQRRPEDIFGEPVHSPPPPPPTLSSSPLERGGSWRSRRALRGSKHPHRSRGHRPGGPAEAGGDRTRPRDLRLAHPRSARRAPSASGLRRVGKISRPHRSQPLAQRESHDRRPRTSQCPHPHIVTVRARNPVHCHLPFMHSGDFVRSPPPPRQLSQCPHTPRRTLFSRHLAQIQPLTGTDHTTNI